VEAAVATGGQDRNDRPIAIKHEQWYSRDLQVVVLSETKGAGRSSGGYGCTRGQRGATPRVGCGCAC
jgi:hypothetical protein